MVSRAPERIPPELGGLVVRPPAEETDVDSAMSGAFEDVQRRAATVRHLEGWPHERDRRPDTLLRELDRLTDAAKGGLTVDPGDDVIPGTRRVGARVDERYRQGSLRRVGTLRVRNGR